MGMVPATHLEAHLEPMEAPQPMSDDDLITVCDHCFCACCWQGEFFCDEYKTAGTTKMTRGELKARRGRGEGAAEHEHYWKTDEELCAARTPTPAPHRSRGGSDGR